MDLPLGTYEGFDWDEGNYDKNTKKHNVTPLESEEVFFNRPIIVAEDIKHSQTESRYYVLGKTNAERKLYLVFTPRKKLIRIICARPMSRNEKEIYDTHEKADSKI